MTISRLSPSRRITARGKLPTLPFEIGEDAVAAFGAERVKRALETRFVVKHALLPPLAPS